MALVGFARVSSVTQDLGSQIKALEEYGCEKIFSGKHSGKADTNKQAIEELLAYVRSGDTVVITKLDRLGRSLSQVLTTIDELTARKAKLVSLKDRIDTSNNDTMSKAMVQLLGIFAEMERSFIVTRTQEGKKASGNYGGRKPKLTAEQRAEIKKKLKAGVSKVKLSKAYSVSRATILNIENS